MSNLSIEKTLDMWGAAAPSPEEGTPKKKQVIQEIMHDLAPIHDLKKQTDLHEKIRNDDDYDDWDYGMEVTYGKKCL
jgi:hypothetical protein